MLFSGPDRPAQLRRARPAVLDAFLLRRTDHILGNILINAFPVKLLEGLFHESASPEWNVRIAALPFGFSTDGSFSISAYSASNS